MYIIRNNYCINNKLAIFQWFWYAMPFWFVRTPTFQIPLYRPLHDIAFLTNLTAESWQAATLVRRRMVFLIAWPVAVPSIPSLRHFCVCEIYGPCV